MIYLPRVGKGGGGWLVRGWYLIVMTKLLPPHKAVDLLVLSLYRCHTEFCYRCGGKYHHLKFVGNHYDRFSILGCKYNYKPDQPVQRIAVRGALFGGQVMVVPIIAGLAVTAGCAVLGAGIVAAPFYASYVLIRKQRAKRKRANIKKKK